MRLYYFTPEKWGLVAIRDRRIKVARIDDLNDPFELMGWNLRSKEARRKLTAWKAERDAEYGIICFCRKWSHPLLWGHYAEKHKGIAIGFDIPDDGRLFEVKYRRKRLALPTGRQINEDDLNSLLTTKFTGWRYEAEHRLFCKLTECEYANEYYFEKFSAEMRPAEIIVGHRSSISRADIEDALGPEYAGVKRYKARPAFGAFKVVRNLNEHLWL